MGLDFALAALFAVLTVEQWRSSHTAAPLWVAIGSYGSAYLLLAQHALALAVGLSVVAGFVWHKKEPA